MTTTLIADDRAQPFAMDSERRFPLDLESSVPFIWAAYERSLVEIWDPEDESIWSVFETGSWTDDQAAAGSLTWSYHAWLDYPGMAESEAVLIKACLELGVDIDLKYCLSMRAVERARSTDYAHLAARRLGTYEAGPTGTALGDLLDVDLVRRALHADTDLDAYLAAHLLAQDTVDLRMWEAARNGANEAIAIPLDLIIRDRQRMLEVTRFHLGETLPTRTDADRRGVAEYVGSVIEQQERAGRRVPALLPASDFRDRLVAAYDVAAASGLGGVAEAEQPAVFQAAIDEVVTTLADLGVDVAS